MELVVDLGKQPLANNLLTKGDLGRAEPRFPLQLFVCSNCWLLQIGETVPPIDLFSEYLYFSSFSDTLVAHAAKAARRYIKDFGLDEDSLAVEIASNDGYLLKNFRNTGVPCFGIEPAANIAAVAREAGIETLEAFFSAGTAAKVAASRGQADLILGNNVFAHAPEPNDFVSGLARLMKPNGRIVLEFPYAVDFIEKTEFDTVYHEHVFYFSLSALMPLFRRHGLEIVDVEHLSIHGGSLRLFARQGGVQEPGDAVRELLDREAEYRFDRIETYRAFADRIADIRTDLRRMIRELKDRGHSIAAYGASAKGSTLMNFCGFGESEIAFVADRSTYKQGRLAPGTHLPIVSPDDLATRQPDYTLLLTWNFADEILKQQEAYLDAGGKFIIPIPEPHIVGAEPAIR